MLSCHEPGDVTVELVRLVCGDPSRHAQGFEEHVVDVAGLPATIPAREQELTPGSHAIVQDARAIDQATDLRLRVLVHPTLLDDGPQALFGTWSASERDGFGLAIDADGCALVRVGSGQEVAELSSGASLAQHRWTEVAAGYDGATGELHITQTPLSSRSPSDDLLAPAVAQRTTVGPGLLTPTGRPLLFAAHHDGDRVGGHFDGRLEAPTISDGDGATLATWDFSLDIGTDRISDVGPEALHGHTMQLPARGVTGSAWTGEHQRWSDAPEQYGAIHFHGDDLVDAGWDTDVEVRLPEDLASGVYAFRSTAASNVDRTTLFVRPADRAPRAAVAFLAPTATYLAYANHRMTLEGADFFPARESVRPHFRYIRDHPEVGLSHYEYHRDRHGVMYSSRLRPIMNLKAGADGWAFTADTNIVAFLEGSEHDFDVITDEDLHRDGLNLLDHYRVVVTGSHPEYWSTAMLDALEDWQRGGGRLMYLGGNGFYWRVAFSDAFPGVMEVRRAEDGTRGWIAEPGEYYHEFTGEYGGLWRRLGRPPNALVGVGFAAQGFDRAAPYTRTDEADDSRVAWIFDGIDSVEFGDFGVGGGAAGQEIDRYDPRLGSPGHALVVATARNHSPLMLRTKEEFHATVPDGPDEHVRADVVFFETPAGGAVFSVGSIAWFGALAAEGYDNDVARMTANVLNRFVDPLPFEFAAV